MIKRKYVDDYKIIAENFASAMLSLIESLGVHIENIENQKNAITNNIKPDFRKNIPNVNLLNAKDSQERMIVLNKCNLLDILEIVELMSPDNLRSVLYREFLLTCSIIESVTMSPLQKQRIRKISRNATVFNLLWKPYSIYFNELEKIKPLILKIYEFQSHDHVKEDLNLYSSNPKIESWISAVKSNPRYHSEFKKYLGFLKKQELVVI